MPDGSRSVAPPRETRTSLVTGGLESAVVWMPASAGKLIARVEVQDAAHNVASQEKSAPCAPRRRINYASPAMRPPERLLIFFSRACPGWPPRDSLGRSQHVGATVHGGNRRRAVPPYTADEESPITGDPGGLQLIEPPQNLPVPADDFKPSPAAEIHLRRRNSVAMGNLPERDPAFAEYLRLQPDDHGARYEYAGLLLQQRQFAEGQVQLQRLIAAQPTVGADRMLLADVFLQMKNYEAVREQLTAPARRSALRRAGGDPARPHVPGRASFADAQKIYDDHIRQATNLTIEERLAGAAVGEHESPPTRSRS